MNDNFYEASFEVYYISVRLSFDFRNLLRPKYELQWPHWGLKSCQWHTKNYMGKQKDKFLSFKEEKNYRAATIIKFLPKWKSGGDNCSSLLPNQVKKPFNYHVTGNSADCVLCHRSSVKLEQSTIQMSACLDSSCVRNIWDLGAFHRHRLQFLSFFDHVCP